MSTFQTVERWIRPSMAINKEIDLRFVVGYTPLRFRDTLQMLAEGELKATRRSPAQSDSRGWPAPSRRSPAPNNT